MRDSFLVAMLHFLGAVRNKSTWHDGRSDSEYERHGAKAKGGHQQTNSRSLLPDDVRPRRS